MLAYSDIATGGTSDKVYKINLTKAGDGWSVIAQYGRRGSAMATDDKTKRGLLDYPAAKKLYDKVLREKLAKGYDYSGESTSAPVMPPRPAAAPAATTVINFQRPQELLTEVTEGTVEHLLRSPDYWMQDKSDGHSRGVVKTDGEIFGINKLGKRVALSAELHAELARIPLNTFQIDAELVGQRLIARDITNANMDIHQLPYENRFKILVAALAGADPKLATVVETWEGKANKTAALERQKELNREGVTFKLKSAPHRAGRNGQHKKFKFVKTLSAIAGQPGATGKDSVDINLIDAKHGGYIRVASVSLIGKPEVKAGDILEVRYLYAFPSKKLSQARLERIRDDIDPSECTTSQLQFKAEAE